MVNYGRRCPAPGGGRTMQTMRSFSASSSQAALPGSPHYGPEPSWRVSSCGPTIAIWRQYSYSAIVVAVATL